MQPEQEMIHQYLKAHQGSSVRKVYLHISQGVKTTLQQVHEHLLEMKLLGLVEDGFQVNEGMLWWAKSKKRVIE